MARFLAIDWDQGLLHVIAAEVRSGSVSVRSVGVWQEPEAPNPASAEDQGRRLRERLREAGIALAPVLGCIGRDRVIVKEVRFPVVPDSEEPAVVRFQALKELTDPPEEVVLDYLLAGSGTLSTERRATVLVVRREIVEAYRKICEAAGLKLAALTPRLTGVSACLRQVVGKTVVTPPPTPPEGVICVVAVGEKFAEISVLNGDTFLLTRAVPTGGNLAGEIRRNLAVHAGQMPQFPVVAVYVTGQGSGELQHRLEELVEIPVHTFDPFALVETVDLNKIGPADIPRGNRGTFAGAMGLLYRKSTGDIPINFVSPRQPKPPTNTNYQLIRLAAVAVIALFIGLVVLGRVLHAAWAEDLAQIKEEEGQVNQRLMATQLNLKRLKAIDDWDSPVWLDELYDLTVRIPDVNALRVTSLSIDPLARSANSKAAARWTIKGKLLGKTNLRRPLDQLVSQLTKEGYYRVEAPKVESDQFTLVVYVERRGPADYKHQLTDALIKSSTPARSKMVRKSEDNGEDEMSEDEDEKPSKSKGRSKFKGRRR